MIKVLGVFFLILGILLVARFVLGGKEDTWICRNGEWVKHGNPVEPMPIIPCEKEGQSIEDVRPTGEYVKVSFEESQTVAENFAPNSSTYKFDGSGLKLESFESLKCPYCWEFKFIFDSKQSGYGDRKGQILAQVITPHTLLVTVNQGKIVSAVVDGTFDELNLKFIK